MQDYQVHLHADDEWIILTALRLGAGSKQGTCQAKHKTMCESGVR
jgi:hypothetical protein